MCKNPTGSAVSKVLPSGTKNHMMQESEEKLLSYFEGLVKVLVLIFYHLSVLSSQADSEVRTWIFFFKQIFLMNFLVCFELNLCL